MRIRESLPVALVAASLACASDGGTRLAHEDTVIGCRDPGAASADAVVFCRFGGESRPTLAALQGTWHRADDRRLCSIQLGVEIMPPLFANGPDGEGTMRCRTATIAAEAEIFMEVFGTTEAIYALQDTWRHMDAITPRVCTIDIEALRR